MLGNKNIKVEMIRQYDTQTGTYFEEKNIKVNMQRIQAGLIKEIGSTRFAVLMAIVSFCDLEGEAFPSQRKIAEITGFSKTTVNRAIRDLLQMEVDGVPILSRELETLGSRTKFSVYSILPSKKGNDPKEKTARDYMLRYMDLFKETYGFDCSINFASAGSLIKSKLMAKYTEEEVTMVIEQGVLQYKERWSNTAYPYPSLNAICTWIADTLIKEHKAEQERIKKAEKIMEQSKGLEERTSDILDIL